MTMNGRPVVDPVVEELDDVRRRELDRRLRLALEARPRARRGADLGPL